MNRTYILGFIILVIGMVVIFLVRNASQKMPDFSIADAERVWRISLTREGHTLVLEQQDGDWFLNDSIAANPALLLCVFGSVVCE